MQVIPIVDFDLDVDIDDTPHVSSYPGENCPIGSEICEPCKHYVFANGPTVVCNLGPANPLDDAVRELVSIRRHLLAERHKKWK